MIRTITVVTVILGILSSVMLVFLFGALHDISRDYASAETWTRDGGAVPASVPDWAACDLEWSVVEVAWWLLVVFHIAFFVFLVARRRVGRRTVGLE